MTSPLLFYVNEKLIKEDNPNHGGFLADYLRRKVGLTGTKVACGEGGCGSCTILLSKYDPQSKKFKHSAINACITPISSIHGCHILTIEGVGGGTPKSCHFLQDAIAKGNGTQCGFCTPGMVMSAHALHCSEKNPDIEDIKNALQGNLCRCTGYRPILEAFKKCSDAPIEELPSSCTPCLEGNRIVKVETSPNIPQIEALMKNFHNSSKCNVTLRSQNGSTWLRPDSLPALLDILNEHKTARIVGGSTELFSGEQPQSEVFVQTDQIPEMRVAEIYKHEGQALTQAPSNNYVRLGGALTISEMIIQLKDIVAKLPSWQTRSLCTIMELTEKFGSAQIRNAATLGGSIMTSNVGSDIQTLFSGLKGLVTFVSRDTKELSLEFATPIHEFRARFGSNDVVVVAVGIPLTEKSEFTWAHKVIKRNVNDAAIMNFAVTVKLSEGLSEVEEANVSVGGKAILAFQLELIPTGIQRRINDGGFGKYLVESLTKQISARQTENATYCNTLVKNLCIKFSKWLNEAVSGRIPKAKGTGFKSVQTFDKTSEDQLPTDLVGKPIPHASAYKHASGEARYLDDTPKYKDELALGLVLSKRPHAFIKGIDWSKALAVEGVVGFVGSADISSPEKNRFGLVVKDEEIFASEKVNCFGQIIGGILGKSRAIAAKAANLVVVEYEDIKPCLLTIDDAIKHNSYYDDFGMVLENGNCNQDFKSNTISGSFEIGSQAHFYMETQSCLAIPNGEDGEMEIISSTQNPMDTQLHVATVLDVPANRVVVKVKRVGGGFGGKESRSLMVALPVAVAAKKFGVPVRCVLDRKTDMLISGKRNAFRAVFTVNFTSEGRIQALRLKVYANAGHSLDVSNAAIERCIINVDNAYNIPNLQAEGFVCKTNIASNTVFRGTGAPQAALIIEHIFDLIAAHVQRDPAKVRQLNLYNSGDVTPYGQTLHNYTIQMCWEECMRASKYNERLVKIEKFNKENEWRKRGISLNPAHYGVAYTALFLNQASALIMAYRDGSVLLSHGGVEIGQGLHSKMIQVATRELGISSDKIRILETATDKAPNGTPTSASSSSDLNGMAVIDACQKLMKRLEPYKTAEPKLSWEELVLKAYFDRVSLSATGFYKVPGIGWNETTKKGSPFNYYSTGVACTEVELDCLTGQHQILRTDIVMDVGKSLNPAIDLGQIEGAFTQGVGLFTIENLKFNSDGAVETLGPNTYKIPTAADIPLEFNVSFLSGSSNPKAVYSSKTVGEPPLLLATSVFFAIKDAIRRKVAKPTFEFNSPATVERILMALQE